MRRDDILRMAHDIVDRCAVESDCIEYKKSASDVVKDGILKTACAYANNYMNREIGLLFIGIQEEDDEETGRKAVPVRPITGIEEAKIESVENTLKSLLSHIHPKPTFHLLQDKIDDRFYVILAVEPGSDGPYETDQKAEKDPKIRLKAGRYIRIRRDTRIPNRTEEFELLRKFAEFHFSSELNREATLDDLDFEYMKEYLARTKAAADIRVLSKLEMAKALHLIDASEYGGYRARNFAVLMFAPRPADFIPYAYVRIIREVKGTDKMESKVFDGPVWIQAQQVRDYFRDTIMSTYTVREPGVSGAHRVSNWPLEMFEELATNCILHKDYSRKQHIEIAVYRDHISFINHNRPLPPVTIEDLNEKTVFDDRQYVNDELKDMFFKLDLIQSYGSGIRRAKNSMAANGSPKLVFTPNNDLDDYTLAEAYINEEFARIQEEENHKKETHELQSANERSLKEVLKEVLKEADYRKVENIIEVIDSQGSISPAEAKAVCGKSDSTTWRYLNILTATGLVISEGSTNHVRYRRSKD
ncbi:MAG: putative DNA binding domain-containing protein [Blautia sp.]|nr:putative DNA binding domain-containing protein [Blautia sp.]